MVTDHAGRCTRWDRQSAVGKKQSVLLLTASCGLAAHGNHHSHQQSHGPAHAGAHAAAVYAPLTYFDFVFLITLRIIIFCRRSYM